MMDYYKQRRWFRLYKDSKKRIGEVDSAPGFEQKAHRTVVPYIREGVIRLRNPRRNSYPGICWSNEARLYF